MIGIPLVLARFVRPNRASAPCPWCRREHVYDTTGKTGQVIYFRAQCRVKRALNQYGFPRVIALRIQE